MKILYTIGALIAVAIIALGVASFGGDTSVSELFTQQEESQQQEEYVDNTGDIVGGLPERIDSEVVTKEDNQSKQFYTNYKLGFEILPSVKANILRSLMLLTFQVCT